MSNSRCGKNSSMKQFEPGFSFFSRMRCGHTSSNYMERDRAKITTIDLPPIIFICTCRINQLHAPHLPQVHIPPH